METVLIANRGEIACRIIRSCRALGLKVVSVYSEADAGARHVALADRAIEIGPGPAKDSYLVGEKIIGAARQAGADAVHPGYGFLAENARFAEAVTKAGLVWIGPRAQTIADMGDKERARDIAKAVGIPVLPGSPRFPFGDLDGLAKAAEEVGYPLLVKASAGGGGIGMRRVDGPETLDEVVTATQAMADKAFGDGTVYLERLVEHARHIEIQIFGFGDGHAVHFFERDCSLQRRYQKIIEESPAPGLPDIVRQNMANAAVTLAHHERYGGAGTVEFVVDADSLEFYFLEMNTRIQVEHPVTEMATGRDLVELQLRLAIGDLPPFEQRDVRHRGHAIECRIYAENPDMNFMPSPGTLERFLLGDAAEDVRIDCGVREGDKITFYYDPMIFKVICHADDRSGAIAKMIATLANFDVDGVKTNIRFLMKTLDHRAFRDGQTHTRFIDQHKMSLLES